jgi:hypothetical protein
MGSKPQVFHKIRARMWKTWLLITDCQSHLEESPAIYVSGHYSGLTSLDGVGFGARSLFQNVQRRKLPPRKRIAMAAHDHKRKDLIDWAEFNEKGLAGRDTSRLLSVGC